MGRWNTIRGFFLAIKVDLVLDKSTYIFGKLSCVARKLHFVLTCVRFTGSPL